MVTLRRSAHPPVTMGDSQDNLCQQSAILNPLKGKRTATRAIVVKSIVAITTMIEFPALTESVRDDGGRLVEESHYYSLYEEGNRGGAQYKLLNKTELRYNKGGQVDLRMYYRGDKLTTTHVFVYE